MLDSANPQDARVQVHDPYLLDYWSVRLATPPQRLKAAVEAAGDSLADVLAFLRQPRAESAEGRP